MDFMGLGALPVVFRADGVFRITCAGFEAATHALRVGTLNHYTAASMVIDTTKTIKTSKIKK